MQKFENRAVDLILQGFIVRDLRCLPLKENTLKSLVYCSFNMEIKNIFGIELRKKFHTCLAIPS